MADRGCCAHHGCGSLPVAQHHQSGSSQHSVAAGANQCAVGGPMISTQDYIRILPEIVLAVFGMIVMIVEPIIEPRGKHKSIGVIALIGAAAAIAASIYQMRYPGTAFWNAVQVDSFSIFFHIIVTVVVFLVIMASISYLH